ncbi:hypothetical protein KHC23_08675 [Ancylobacter dichloromethanicus]|uniref:Uncharacterized protein n=1 Tax=Ancylobacter dichloromethanicus TaxID=518825 RepID=A0A9W6JBX9_9HYPH|nr:hypothetical protein [Ancylobacter dichloromethanicus]MBS7553723.1 hypothetical protein [Ancylobacter dichloromethanicus]GLK74686.1 hypothetical protein GCM10017643_48050 [Ancylobacter dichloromethanicus]
MRYLIFDSEAVALDALALIDQRGRDCFAAAGYTVREDGAIIGKRAGEDDPAGITVTWDTPRQRIDGKWVLAHIEAHPMRDYLLPSGETVLAYVMAAPLDAATVEDDDPGWWPAPEEQVLP